MIKAHKHSKKPMMRRSARIYINWLNKGKQEILISFLNQCHDVTQYFIDLLWQKKDFSSNLADIDIIHKATQKFLITVRLAQALAKQAKEAIKAANELGNPKPNLRKHTTTLYSHFVNVERFNGSFDYAVNLIGSGAPRLVIPVKSTKVVNTYLAKTWTVSKTIRIGYTKNKTIFIDLLLEKERPKKKENGKVVGMDSNYKNGFVFSDEQIVGKEIYEKIQTFHKRQKNTHKEIKSLTKHCLKSIDFSGIKVLVIENLKNVKKGKRGKFSRKFNRRLSHWIYSSVTDWLRQHCEELGIRLKLKSPWKTSQFCRHCCKWDKRNRKADVFRCIHCGYSDNADHNAAMNIEFLELAGVYGLRSLPNLNVCSQNQTFG